VKDGVNEISLHATSSIVQSLTFLNEILTLAARALQQSAEFAFLFLELVAFDCEGIVIDFFRCWHPP